MSSPVARQVIVIGAGIAGSSAALRLADAGAGVTLIVKGELPQSASHWAQGGIAAAIARDDSWQAHASDTLRAGAGLSDPQAGRHYTAAAPEMIGWLSQQGVGFTHCDQTGELHLTREGGHGARRIVHADDATGAAVMRVLLDRVAAHPGITCLEHHVALDVVTDPDAAQATVAGLRMLDCATGRLHFRAAGQVVLATGGAAGVFERHTHPDGASGDGIAMAWRAGCRVANLEYVQFHPTCLHVDENQAVDVPLLISEAVRGEGGHLLGKDGTRFMPRYHADAELACRDIVARAIVTEMQQNSAPCVFLDISHRPATDIQRRFPAIYARCLALGFDMTREPLPVSPAAHYTCGGIVTGAQGATDVAGLYAIGECAFTGLHGANRLASNSLLEGLVGARDICGHILARGTVSAACEITTVQDAQSGTVPAGRLATLRQSLERTMTRSVGIVRTRRGLGEALDTLELLSKDLDALWHRHTVTRELVDLRNAVCAAQLITRSAAKNPGSRGAHFNADRPAAPAAAVNTVLQPRDGRASQAA